MASAIAFVSSNVSGARSSRSSPSGIRYIGGDPTLTCRSEPSLLNKPANQPLNSSMIGSVTSSIKPLSCEWRPPLRPALYSSSRERLDFSSNFSLEATWYAGTTEGTGSGPARDQAADAGAFGQRFELREASEGREAPSMPSSSPRWTAQTSSRCSSSRSRNGQSRREISTVLALRRRNRGSKPASASASWSTARLGPDGTARSRARDAAPHQVRPPLAGDRLGPVELALAADQPGQDLAKQSVIASLPSLTGDRRVHHLGTADGRDPMDLARGQARLLQATEMRAERVRMQRQTRRELADRDGPTRQTQVAVEPIARIVGERLVDLDGAGSGMCPTSPYDGFPRFTPCQPE